ncbi:50S ribosomal protein L6 [uncultured Methanobrevibacter sp.]|uniref:50S ribosomal protein L6 n=1 Tax=uncultured Methanobrevibacter sp. TaxID=253161 RepID=UPI0025FFDDF1|nr:50S ribosomal protein L6 [uncultured Methanobrevibacter sp.]
MVVAAAIRETIEVPEGVEVIIENNEVSVKGPNGEDSRKFTYPNVNIKKDVDVVVLETAFPKKKDKAMIGTTRAHINNMIVGVTDGKDKAMIGTTRAHINNMIVGVTDGFTYHMKIVFAHFPMTVKVQNDTVVIDNFLGERHPRTAKIVGSAKVAVKGDEVTITGINKEHVGQTMANLEQATKIKGRDPRVFQDGIYLTSKE